MSEVKVIGKQEALGVGRPDFTPAVAASKPVVIENQEEWSSLTLVKDLAAGSIETKTVYTVPAGYKLNFGGIIVTCSASCIQKLIVYTPGSIIGDYLYDMRGDIVFGPLNSKSVPAAQDIILYIYNNDSVARDFSVLLSGTLEKVA